MIKFTVNGSLQLFQLYSDVDDVLILPEDHNGEALELAVDGDLTCMQV